MAKASTKKAPSPKASRSTAATATLANATVGDTVFIDEAGDGTARSVVAVDLNTLPKGAIYMTRGGDNIWFMATKSGPPSENASAIIVFQYDGPYR